MTNRAVNTIHYMYPFTLFINESIRLKVAKKSNWERQQLSRSIQRLQQMIQKHESHRKKNKNLQQQQQQPSQQPRQHGKTNG